MSSLSVLRAAEEVPSRDAIIWDGTTLSYADVATRVSSICAVFDAQRLGPRARVVLWSSNHLASTLTILAFIERGVTLVPIHPRLTSAEAERLAGAANPSRILMEDDLDGFVRKRAHDPVAPRDIDPRETLAMLFTSGTTGTPKGALLPRSAFLAAAAASAENLGGFLPTDRWLACMPLCHIGGLSILTRCLIARSCVIVHPRFDAEAVLRSIEHDRATLLSVVPLMLRRLLDADTNGVLTRLRAVLVGGAAAPPALLEECASRGVSALTTYGLTEACSQVTSQRPRDPFTAQTGSGRPLPGVDVSVLDEHGAPLGPGKIGRIHVGGPTVMSGYFGAPALQGAFDTGDIGTTDEDGTLHVHARRTDLIVSGGENVYPVEIEETLETLPGVRRAFVFGVADDTWGEIVAAAIERDETSGKPCDEPALHAALSACLAPHKRPRRVCFVDEIPLAGGGDNTRKVDRARGRAVFTAKARAWAKGE